MRRFLLATGGFSVFYVFISAIHTISYWESCGMWEFCVLPSNSMHPLFVWFLASEVAAFSMVLLFLLQTALLVSMWGAVALWSTNRFGGINEATFVACTAGCIPPFSVALVLWHFGVGAYRYGGHPILFWQEQMYVQDYLVVMMALFSVMGASTLLWAICTGLYSGIQHMFSNTRMKGR